MKKFVTAAAAAGIMFISQFSFAQDGIIESVLKGCQTELTTYCAEVVPGEGRGLACLYAHGDKISAQCEYALYDAAAQLERFVGALTYLANECAEDLENICGEVVVGGGRVAQCLLDNKANVAPRCAAAMDQTQLHVE